MKSATELAHEASAANCFAYYGEAGGAGLGMHSEECRRLAAAIAAAVADERARCAKIARNREYHCRDDTSSWQTGQLIAEAIKRGEE
jgi:hypothetical protein